MLIDFFAVNDSPYTTWTDTISPGDFALRQSRSNEFSNQVYLTRCESRLIHAGWLRLIILTRPTPTAMPTQLSIYRVTLIRTQF